MTLVFQIRHSKQELRAEISEHAKISDTSPTEGRKTSILTNIEVQKVNLGAKREGILANKLISDKRALSIKQTTTSSI